MLNILLSFVLVFMTIIIGFFYYKNYRQKEILLYLLFLLLSELFILQTGRNIFGLIAEVFCIIMFLMIMKLRKSIDAFKVFAFMGSIYILLSLISEIGSEYKVWIYSVLIIAVLLKFAVFPVMWWLPKVVEDTDSITAATVICLPEVVDFTVLMCAMERLSHTNSVFYLKTKIFLIFLGILTLLVAAIMAFVEKDLKKMLAYSSIDDSGYLLIGIGIFSNISIIASIILLINHVIAKLGMFLIADKLERISGTLDMEKLGGQAERFPIGAGAFLVFALTLIGVPFTPGFTGKYLIYLSAFKENLWFALVMILSSIITLIYYIKAYQNIFLGRYKPEFERVKKESDFILLIIAILFILAGIYISLPIFFIKWSNLTFLMGR
jgi:multicomponent Na+:H+ antiporter subunit D